MTIYTDGACSSKDNIGGWACVDAEHDENYFGYEENSTNNRMELTAVINALELIKAANDKINEVYTDSAYVANCFAQKWYNSWRRNGWRNSSKQAVKNRELWERLLALYEDIQARYGVILEIIKVNGHAGDKYNELCDKLAVEARKNKRKKEVNGETN